MRKNQIQYFKKLRLVFGCIVSIPMFYILIYQVHQKTFKLKPGDQNYFNYQAKVADNKEDDSTEKKKLNEIKINTTNKHHGINMKSKSENFAYKVALEDVAKGYPNIPIKYWKEIESKVNEMFYKNSSCAPFPKIYDLDMHNTHWQSVHMSESTTLQLYSAYYDKREIFPGKDVRILAMVNRTNDAFPGNKTIHCQLWFKGENEPVIVPMNKLDYMWIDYWHSQNDGMLGPYLLGCSLPQSHENKVPIVVSLVEDPCDNARNMLKVIYEEPKDKKEFAVCVKGLDFLQIDLSIRLIEWIEIILLMGVDKIFMYEFEVHPNVKKVLNYYSELGVLDVRPITLPGKSANFPLLRHEFLVDNNIVQCLDEIIPYNDCFYRNLYSHDYVALLDIDEIILPLKDDNWHDLIERAKRRQKKHEKFSAYSALHVLFLDEMQKGKQYLNIPSYMHMLQHVFRSRNISAPGHNAKAFFRTDMTLSCHNHWPISVAPDAEVFHFEANEARTQHYRNTCNLDTDCSLIIKNSVKDTRIWYFKDVLIPRIEKSLRNLQLL